LSLAFTSICGAVGRLSQNVGLPHENIASTRDHELINDILVQAVNKAAVRIAFLSIAIGVTSAIAIIWSDSRPANAVLMKVIASSAFLFGGAALALCTVKYFYANHRNSNKEINEAGP
jgi:hypothetical protein